MFQALAQHMDQPLILAEHLGLPGVDAGFGDQRRDVHAGVVRAGQQQRHHDGAVGQRREDLAKVRRILLTERDVNLHLGPQQPDGVRDAASVGRRPRVGTAVCGQDEHQDACNPHSVLARPCQRPLRGSAPSIGFAVQGAHPIDG